MITWEHPEWFLGLLAVPLCIVFFAWVDLRRRKLVRLFASETTLREIKTDGAATRRRMQDACYVACLAFVILALAGPKWGYHWQEVHREGIDMFIGLDLSKSMLAEDVKPNRLERARREIGDLLDILPADRIGIIAFSGTSFVSCPLTLDHEVARMFVDDFSVGQIERPGTDIGSVITRALKSFQTGSGNHRAILLISDGEDLEGKGIAAAHKAKEAGIKIFCVGIGTQIGAPIPVADEEGHKGFLKDREGKTVVSKLGGDSLQKIALDTGGAYLQISGGAFQLASFYKDQIAKMEKGDLGGSRKRVYENRFQWPLSVALLLFVVGFIMEDRLILPRIRRPFMRKQAEKIVVSLLVLVLPILGGWGPFDSGRVKQANHLFSQGQYNQAQEQYVTAQARNPDAPELYYNLADVKYKMKEYPQSEEMLKKVLLSPPSELQQKAFYNLGNVKVRQGQLEESLNFYKKAMDLDANDKDAKFNYEWVTNKIKKMKQQSQQQQQQDQKQQGQNKDKDKDKNNSQSQDQKDQQKGQSQGKNKEQQQQQKKDQKDQQQQQQKQQQKNAPEPDKTNR